MKTWQKISNYLLKLIPKRIKSGTADFPDMIDVFNEMMAYFPKLGDRDKMLFTQKTHKGWAEVRPYRGDILVTFYYPYKKPPKEILPENGVNIPEWWGLNYYKKKKRAAFLVGLNRIDTVPGFLDLVFRNLYGCNETSIIKAKTVLECWQYK